MSKFIQSRPRFLQPNTRLLIAALATIIIYYNFRLGSITSHTATQVHTPVGNVPSTTPVNRNTETTPEAKQTSQAVEKMFTGVYSAQAWTNEGGGSGIGSGMEATKRIRTYIEILVCKLRIKSMIDAPCGSFFWMPHALQRIQDAQPSCLEPNTNFTYMGVDVVKPVIDNISKTYEDNPNWSFKKMDISIDPLPAYELIFSRDALQHLSYPLIINSLENFAHSPAKYLAVGSYINGTNISTHVGGYFPIDLRQSPFNLDFPIDVFDEELVDRFSGDMKVVLVYRIEDLRQVDFEKMRQEAGVDV